MVEIAMQWDFLFFFNSVLLGVGLAMDAFSVSLANGLHEPKMKKFRMNGIAGTYAFFQFLMPMIGWICVHTILQYFKIFEYFIPWITLGLLGWIGGKIIYEYFKGGEEEDEVKILSFWTLIVQGIATSIDALSVGFTISEYNVLMAFVSSLIIAIVTYVICMGGLVLGKKFGTRFASKAGLIGGLILVGIGFEIFISNIISLYF